ncbi:MFS transporter [Chitinasiproducens palmae]|uniref:MFS transporter, putative metabolite:H+ symporter n=1 Tax=Chitinasiproducens palmae TaxID=1770053 RepID=A0A1H2PMB0_9BURK|nr:MFS transporter [Chitinasiproducens palmae]SDV47243.1 MFS transporter, putative metabolite:H+ symporter [Chitinasiproducens palmae]
MSQPHTLRAHSGARLDRLPVGRFHWRLVGMIGAGLFLDAFDIYLQSGVLATLAKSGWSTLESNAAFISSTLIGMWLGSLIGGYIGDRYGRRMAYQFNLAVFGAASIAAVFAPSMTVLIVLRFVMGVGLGAELIIGYATLGEFVPSLARGRFGAILALLTNLSVTVTGIVGYWAIPALGWRSMFALVGLGAVGIWFMRKSMPESPRWLESQGRHEEADALLRSIEAGFPDLPAWHVASAPATTAPADAAPAAATPGYRALFKRPLLSRTVLTMIMSTVNMSVLYGLIAWFPTFLVKQGIAVTSTLGYTAVMGIGTPVGCLIGMALTDRVGRRVSIVGVLALEAVATALYPTVHSPAQLMVTGAVIMMCSACITSLAFAVYIPELFPTELRMRGSSLSAAVGRLASAGAQAGIVVIFGMGGIFGVTNFLIGLIVLQILALMVLGVNTRARTLEDIAPEAGAQAERAAKVAQSSAMHGRGAGVSPQR